MFLKMPQTEQYARTGVVIIILHDVFINMGEKPPSLSAHKAEKNEPSAQKMRVP